MNKIKVIEDKCESVMKNNKGITILAIVTILFYITWMGVIIGQNYTNFARPDFQATDTGFWYFIVNRILVIVMLILAFALFGAISFRVIKTHNRKLIKNTMNVMLILFIIGVVSWFLFYIIGYYAVWIPKFPTGTTLGNFLKSTPNFLATQVSPYPGVFWLTFFGNEMMQVGIFFGLIWVVLISYYLGSKKTN